MDDHNTKTFPDFFKVFKSAEGYLRLSIPDAAVAHFEGLTGQKFILRGRAGRLWDVELMCFDNHACFGSGWEKFREDNFMEPGYFLVFMYAGQFVYDCRIMDVSGCENQEDRGVEEEEDEEEDIYAEEEEDDADYEEEAYVSSLDLEEEDDGGNVVADKFSRISNVSTSNNGQTSSNPLFVPKFCKRRANELNVPKDVFQDYCLELEDGSKVTLIGTWEGSPSSTGTIKVWKDGRKSITGWSAFCRDNRVTTGDIRECEFLPGNRGEGESYVIKVHLADQHLEGQRSAGLLDGG